MSDICSIPITSHSQENLLTDLADTVNETALQNQFREPIIHKEYVANTIGSTEKDYHSILEQEPQNTKKLVKDTAFSILNKVKTLIAYSRSPQKLFKYINTNIHELETKLG